MKFFLRTITAVLAALWLAAPTTGNVGGENAGGTGVWILPGSRHVGGPPPVTAAASASRQLSSFARDLTMVVDGSLGAVVATAVDPGTGLMVPLSVSGRNVTLRASIMQAYRDASISAVRILICDDSNRGYYILFTVAPGGQSGTLAIL